MQITRERERQRAEKAAEAAAAQQRLRDLQQQMQQEYEQQLQERAHRLAILRWADLDTAASHVRCHTSCGPLGVMA
jgi:hypothetical protein